MKFEEGKNYELTMLNGEVIKVKYVGEDPGNGMKFKRDGRPFSVQSYPHFHG